MKLWFALPVLIVALFLTACGENGQPQEHTLYLGTESGQGTPCAVWDNENKLLIEGTCTASPTAVAFRSGGSVSSFNFPPATLTPKKLALSATPIDNNDNITAGPFLGWKNGTQVTPLDNDPPADLPKAL
jgi:hypothetical protein